MKLLNKLSCLVELLVNTAQLPVDSEITQVEQSSLFALNGIPIGEKESECTDSIWEAVKLFDKTGSIEKEGGYIDNTKPLPTVRVVIGDDVREIPLTGVSDILSQVKEVYADYAAAGRKSVGSDHLIMSLDELAESAEVYLLDVSG